VYRFRSVRNSCLDLISSLIEVFGDLAVESILYVIDNLFMSTSPSDGDQKMASPQKGFSAFSLAKSVEEINIFEFTYSSKNKKHSWKKREVALFLVGSFAEDISMYRQRHPLYNLRETVEQIMKTDFNKTLMKSYLKGRSLWCASQLAEIVPRDFEDLNVAFFEQAIAILTEEPANPHLCP
jgi:hypothetical protein